MESQLLTITVNSSKEVNRRTFNYLKFRSAFVIILESITSYSFIAISGCMPTSIIAIDGSTTGGSVFTQVNTNYQLNI